jgi:hypothetical protein
VARSHYPDRERKRLAHLLPEDVTLIKREQLLIHVRFPGGATRTLEMPRRRRVTATQASVIAEVDRLLDGHSPDAVAKILNSRGSVSGYGKPFTGRMIGRMAIKYRLKTRFERLRAKGLLTREEMAQRLSLNTKQVAAWRCGASARAPMQREGPIPLRGPRTRTSKESQGREIIEKSTVRECLATTKRGAV